MTNIREISLQDCTMISAAFAEQGWQKPVTQYERYWRESLLGKRAVLIAEIDYQFAGYLTIEWKSAYPPFHEEAIPEIVDFNVLVAFQRQGVGTALMDVAEQVISNRSERAGIGVGLMPDYGKAQILYAKRGYVPDGRGIYENGRWLEQGDQITIGDNVVMYLTKDLSK